MEVQYNCSICDKSIGKGQKYDLNHRDEKYFVGNFHLELKISETAHGGKVCARCYNRNRELNNQAKKRPAPSTVGAEASIPVKKAKVAEIDTQDRYTMETGSIEALTALLINPCLSCGGRWMQTRQRGRGNILEIDIYCESGHCFIWKSSKIVPAATSETKT